MPSKIKKTAIVILVAISLATMWFFVRAPIAVCLFNKGLKAKSEWRLEKACGYFSQSSFLKNSEDAIFENAECLQLRGEFRESQTILEVLIKNDSQVSGRVLNLSGVNKFNQNLSDDALEDHQNALKIAQISGDQKLAAETLIELSRVQYHAKGNSSEALANLEKAQNIANILNNDKIKADALRNIGVVRWWFKGELDAPLNENYIPALGLYRKIGDLRGEAITLSNIGFIHRLKGDLFKFLESQNQSIEIKERIGDSAGLCDSYAALGAMYLNGGQLIKAGDFFQKSRAIALRTGFLLGLNEVEAYLARIHSELGDFDTAIDLMRDLLEREGTTSVSAKYRVSTLAEYHLLKGDLKKAGELFENALAIERRNDQPDIRAENTLRNYLGFVSLRQNNLLLAEKYFTQARSFDERRGADDVNRHLRPYLFQVEFWLAKGDSEAALKLAEEFTEFERKMFATHGSNLLASPEPRDYEALFDLLLNNFRHDENLTKSSNELVFRFLENRRYRSFRNFIVQATERSSLNSAAVLDENKVLARIRKLARHYKHSPKSDLNFELQNTYSEYENLTLKNRLSAPNFRAISEIRPASKNEIQRILEKDTALVEYLLSRNNVFALILTTDKLRAVKLPISRANLENKVKLFRNLVFTEPSESEISGSKSNAHSDWFPVSESLRESLIEPLGLKNISSLAIIPEGILHDLPFSALASKNGDATRFLVEDFTLFYPPSATFLLRKSQNSRIENGSNRGSLFSFGINASEDLPDLKFAEDEAVSVAQIFEGVARINQNATESAFKESAENASFLHISAHSAVEPNMPLLSRIILAKGDTDDGSLTTREIFSLGLNADLVTIAACESGIVFSPEQNTGDANRIGLTEAFLSAGASSVLSSLSPVNDRSTTKFMKSFYSNLLHHRKAESLAIAQRMMIVDSAENGFSHPRYWSPFILVGNK